jgi:hypothetical protein
LLKPCKLDKRGRLIEGSSKSEEKAVGVEDDEIKVTEVGGNGDDVVIEQEGGDGENETLFSAERRSEF